MKKFKVTGNSMYPVLKDGDVFLGRRRRAGEIPETGAVVVAEYGGRLIVKQFFRQTDGGGVKAYLLGFNGRQSRDSRSYGALPLEAVKYIRITGGNCFREAFRGLREYLLAKGR